jgi:hypothetical protein
MNTETQDIAQRLTSARTAIHVKVDNIKAFASATCTSVGPTTLASPT